jgi:hypothetical protein
MHALADALESLGVERTVGRDDDHLWKALDIGAGGVLLMVSVMRQALTGPSAAATIVLDHNLPEDAAQEEAEALLEVELAPDGPTWLLGT